MVQIISSLLVAVAFSVDLVLGAAVTARNTPIGTSLKICTDANFQGDCDDIFVEHDTCTHFPPGYVNDVSSIASPGPWACTLYFSSNCATSESSWTIPAGSSYASLPVGDNAFNSVYCPERQ